MQNMKKSLPYLFVILMLTMTSCEEKKNNGSMSGDTYLEEYEQTPTWEELLADSIVEKEHVGKECGVICNNLDIATDRLTHVLSPEGLITAKKATRPQKEQAPVIKNVAASTSLGDIDALAALKEKMDDAKE